jgi:hypothetical protein
LKNCGIVDGLIKALQIPVGLLQFGNVCFSRVFIVVAVVATDKGMLLFGTGIGTCLATPNNIATMIWAFYRVV